jgi:hypothetical protein
MSEERCERDDYCLARYSNAANQHRPLYIRG